MKLYKKKIALLVATILVVTTLCSCSKGSQNSGLKDVDLSTSTIEGILVNSNDLRGCYVIGNDTNQHNFPFGRDSFPYNLSRMTYNTKFEEQLFKGKQNILNDIKLQIYKELYVNDKTVDSIDKKKLSKLLNTLLRELLKTKEYEFSIGAYKINVAPQKLSVKYETKTHYENVIVTNSYNEDKCVKLTWNSADLLIDESDLEQSLINHLQKFLLELGRGFSFVARQQHINFDGRHFYIDLVFYNYIWKCFVLIYLKTKKITHELVLKLIKKISTVIGRRLDVSFYTDKFEMVSTKYANEKLVSLVNIDPTIRLNNYDADMPISFVPMECIDEEYGIISETRETTISQTKGYTRFEENDLLWAKITPCMQNGKSAIARHLKNGLGCGSTEYYVMRPKSEYTLIDYIYIVLRNKKLLEAAQSSFGGSAGQQRVSSQYLKSIMIPHPDISVQKEIVDTVYNMRDKAKKLKEEGEVLLNEAKQQIEKWFKRIVWER